MLFPHCHNTLLFATSAGSVEMTGLKEKIVIRFGENVWYNSYRDFQFLLKSTRLLNDHINEVGRIYYRKFLIEAVKYRRFLKLSSQEIADLYDLLGSAKTMLDLGHIIEERVYNDK